MKRNAASAGSHPFRTTALAAALWLAFGASQAQQAPAPSVEELRRDLFTPGSSLSFGLGNLFGDGRRWGEWRGLTEEGPVPLLNLDLVRRDEPTGTWLKFSGRDLGLKDARELRFTHERQGDWSYSLSGVQLTRREPLVVTTGLTGEGTPNPFVSGTADKRQLDLKVDHDIVALGGRKFIGSSGWDVDFGIKEDTAVGARLFGRGTSNVMEFLTEPIDRITRNWHATANYADRTLQLTGGYTGSTYDNHNPVLRATGGNSAATAFGPVWAMAMPPSNASHMLHASGGLNVSPTTRVTAKLSRTAAVQNELFDSTFTRLAGSPDSLNAKVVTTLGFVDLNTRPTKRLSLGASVRFEDRDDQTPQVRWLANANPTAGSSSFGTAGFSGLNKPRSLKQLKAGVEAGYQLDGGYRAIAGIDRERMRRNSPDEFRRVGLREQTGETSGRLEFKRTMSETLNGGVSLVHSQRDGSSFLPDTFDPAVRTNQVAAITWSDRIRDKVRLTADWLPAERWSVQFLGESALDRYDGRNLGLRNGRATLASADLVFQATDKWSVTGFVSHERTTARQLSRTDPAGAAATGGNTDWSADIEYQTRAAGVGVKGQARANLTVGAELNASWDKATHDLERLGGTGTLPVNSLPAIHYRQTGLKFYADHALDRNSGVRIDVLFDRRSTDDFTWANWVYGGSPAIAAASRNSDGTTVFEQARDRVGFVGVTYHLRWR